MEVMSSDALSWRDYAIRKVVHDDGSVEICIPTLGRRLFRAIADDEASARELLAVIAPKLWEVVVRDGNPPPLGLLDLRYRYGDLGRGSACKHDDVRLVSHQANVVFGYSC